MSLADVWENFGLILLKTRPFHISQTATLVRDFELWQGELYFVLLTNHQAIREFKHVYHVHVEICVNESA